MNELYGIKVMADSRHTAETLHTHEAMPTLVRGAAERLVPAASRTTLAGCAAALLLATAGCEVEAGVAPEAMVVRDSAGIEIIENRDHGWAVGEGWRLAEAPELDIGVLEGDSMYQLFRVSGATRTSDGRVAVALAGSSEIRFYGPDGQFRRAVGREGEGPGEFRQLSGIWPFRGDSLVVWDEALRRVTILDSGGSVARQVIFAANPSNPSVLRPLADGRMALVDHRFSFGESGMQDQAMEVTLHSPTGELEDSVGRFIFARMGRIGEEGRSLMGSPIFAPRTDIAVTAQTIVLGDGSAAEFATYESGGMLSRIIRWPDHNRSVEDADIDRYREARVAAIDDENRRREERAYLAAVPYDRRFPVYDRILPTADGGVWLRAFRRPGETGPRQWMVIDAEGRLLGAVAAPERLWIFEVGTDYVLGLERDDLDLEHVRLYRLVKGRAGAS